jgi:hypothetical protein
MTALLTGHWSPDLKGVWVNQLVIPPSYWNSNVRSRLFETYSNLILADWNNHLIVSTSVQTSAQATQTPKGLFSVEQLVDYLVDSACATNERGLTKLIGEKKGTAELEFLKAAQKENGKFRDDVKIAFREYFSKDESTYQKYKSFVTTYKNGATGLQRVPFLLAYATLKDKMGEILKDIRHNLEIIPTDKVKIVFREKTWTYHPIEHYCLDCGPKAGIPAIINLDGNTIHTTTCYHTKSIERGANVNGRMTDLGEISPN